MRFLQAIDRSRAVASAAFASSSSLCAVTSTFEGERRSNRQWSSFQSLRALGFEYQFGQAERVKQHEAEYIQEAGDELYCYWRVAEFPNEPRAIAALLWASVAKELDVLPKSRWIGSIYVVDFDRGIALHVYDDRGMDLIAVDPSALRPIYEEFTDWLLDYDRPRIEAKFGLAR